MKWLNDMWTGINLVFRLTAHDLRSRYLGSTLGFVWAFIQPFVMTIILWLVVSLAFKAGAVRGVPFIAWLLAGMSAWSFFSDAWNQATNVFCEYAFLVRKVNFRLFNLPLMKILSALAVHGVFLLIVALVLLFSQIAVTWSWLAVFYYLFAAAVLLAGLSYISAALNVFLRDVGHIVSVGLQFGFWLTPVFWDFSMFPLQGHSILVKLLRLNPVIYIVEGYRNSLLFNSPFTEGWGAAAYFWIVAVGLLGLGMLIFRKLRPHFADVL
ncbi:MAG: ABC transporter permease [Kiritimatiellia bacterium]|nr:ABC transporter permease [Kiritimatiellia bacterium]